MEKNFLLISELLGFFLVYDRIGHLCITDADFKKQCAVDAAND